MIVDRGQQQVTTGFQPTAHHQQHNTRRAFNVLGNEINPEEDEEEEEEDNDDGENDEENIVIDLADEDEDDDDDDDDADADDVNRRDRDCDINRDFESLNPYGTISFYTTNNNINQLKSGSFEQSQNHELNSMSFNAGDLVWFDPNLLGYSIPGKVLDFYPDLGILRIEGCAQPTTVATNDEPNCYELQEAEQELQTYELNERKQFLTVKPRLPISDERGIADLVDMEELSLESIIWNLRLRHKKELVYTQCGQRILVSMNPFKQLSELYNLEQVNNYDTLDTSAFHSLRDISAQLNSQSSELLKWLLLSVNKKEKQQSSPHIFGFANEALRNLLIEGKDQCFVLLGEAGSGKTEACKLLVQYLATVNKSPSNLMTEQILESIQVLESFGNAKSQLNDNSSRFGRLLSIRYDLSNGLIAHASTSDLNLLDRGRIVSQLEGERNYHIFYELLAGLSRSEKEKYGLQNAEKYFYLTQGHCVDLAHKEDGADFRALLASMQVLGFNYEEQDTIFRMLASILHLGNVYFHRKLLALRSGPLVGQQQGASVEGVEVGSDTEVRWVSHLLQIQFDSVLRCLTIRSSSALNPISTCTESLSAGSQADYVLSPLNIDQALDTRDAIARALYTCLFRWLVQRINAMINQQVPATSIGEQNPESASGSFASSRANSTSAGPQLHRTGESLCEFQPDRLARNSSTYNPSIRERSSMERRQASLATMSILDAFGFENLAENGFEQLCINYAAELLQYQSVRYLVRLEQAEYARERLAWRPLPSEATFCAAGQSSLECTGGSGFALQWNAANSGKHPGAVVSLLSRKPLGILALLDDESNFPKASDASFVEKCHHNHTMNDNYERSRAANQNEFGIRHFRQQNRLVWYQADGFIEKNRDCLRGDIVDLLLGSRMAIVSDMLRKLQPPGQTLRRSGTRESGKTLSRTHDGRLVSMKPRAGTVATRFQDALSASPALEALTSTSDSSGPDAWFVVCLRASRWSRPGPFEVAQVEDQARSMGLLELAQIRRAGYPIRFRYARFLRRYRCLIKETPSANSAPHQEDLTLAQVGNGNKKRAVRDLCGRILEPHSSGHQCGLTKVFLSERVHEKLESQLIAVHLSAILLIQRQVRTCLARRNYLSSRRAVVLLQAQVRGLLARKRFWRHYYLVVAIQRRWRQCLSRKRQRALEARRRAKRQQHQYQLMEIQANQRRQADQLRHRAVSGHPMSNSEQRTVRGGVKLRIPHQLTQLYRIQRNWLPVHELSHLTEFNLGELLRNEQERQNLTSREERRKSMLSVPLFARDALPDLSGEEGNNDKAAELLEALENDDRYSLPNFIHLYYPPESPSFGYSRIPILRPFTWTQLKSRLKSQICREGLGGGYGGEELARKEAILRRFRVAEDQALMLYELVLRYIDSEPLNNNTTDQPPTTERVLKFKLLADYLIHLCLLEPLLRNELFLQLASQSWQNPRVKSAENTWRLMCLSLACLQPLDRRLTRFLLRFVSENCIEFPAYRRLLIIQLSAILLARNSISSSSSGQVRCYPPSLAEYWACELALCKFALATSCYMDDRALTGPPPNDGHDIDPEEFARQLRCNQGGRTMALLSSRTSAEELAAAVLKARLIPLENLPGWSLEIQFEGAQSELSCRLRGDQKPLDQLARAELLPELVSLIEQGRKISQTLKRSREDANHLPLSASSKLNQRYHQLNGNYREQMDSSLVSKKKVHRRSTSMQDLQLASWSALNGRYFRQQNNNQSQCDSIPAAYSHYASNRLLQQQRAGYGYGQLRPYQCNKQQHYRRGSLQQLNQHHLSPTDQIYQPSQHPHRRSQTPTAGFPSSSYYTNPHRLSTSSAYGTESRRSFSTAYVPSPTFQECCQPAFTCDPSNCPAAAYEASAHRQVQQQQQRSSRAAEFGMNPTGTGAGKKRPARRSASSSSRSSRLLANQNYQVVSGKSQYNQLSAPPEFKPKNPQLERHRLSSNSSSYQQQQQQTARNPPGNNSITSQVQAHQQASSQPLDSGYYVASSVLSDTSEAASLVSHVRGIKVPANNDDLDQYLDDLFNPVLDEELSDARSLAASFRLSSAALLNPNQQLPIVDDEHDNKSKQIDSTTHHHQAEAAKENLSPTFESLLESLSSNNERINDVAARLVQPPLPPPPPPSPPPVPAIKLPTSRPTEDDTSKGASLSGSSEEQASKLLGSVGKIAISSEMKAKLEQLTVGFSSEKQRQQKVADERKQLLENQLSNGSQLVVNSNNKRDSTSSGVVMAAKQQLAAAAGLALKELDAGNKRKSSDVSLPAVDGTSEQVRRSRAFQDQELGPQTRAAISQRQAFYQQPLTNSINSGDSNSQQFFPSPHLYEPGDERENLSQKQQSQPTESSKLAKSLLQRQHDRLKGGMESPRASDNKWVISSPDPTLEKVRGRKAESAGIGKKQQNAIFGQQQVVYHHSSRGKMQANLDNGQDFSHQDLATREEQFCLAYTSVDWQVKIRKEFFKPSEKYHDQLVVQLIFVQLVADVFNPRHWTRLNNKERAAMKALMKDNSIGYSPSLPEIGQLQEVKQELVRMARSFGLYFTRSYAASNYALASGTGERSSSYSYDQLSLCSSDGSLISSSQAADNELCHDDREELSSISAGIHQFKVRESQATKLAFRLRNADNLGLEWIDMVAVHHSGLRLVALEHSGQPRSARNEQAGGGGVFGCTEQEAAASAQAPIYRVLDTLKYRDMTDVSRVGHRELLVSMRNGKKCWLISCEQAAQLTDLLRSFHADYNDHLGTLTSASASVSATTSTTTTLTSKEAKRSAKQQPHQRKKYQKPSEDALLASNDDHHDDHIQQRQASNNIGRAHKASDSHYDLVNGQRVLSDNLASPNKTYLSQQQHQYKQHQQQQQQRYLDSKQPSSSTPGTSSSANEPLDTCAGNKIKKKKNSKELEDHSSERVQRRGKQTLWQNSLSRMSNKLSIFTGHSTTTTGEGSNMMAPKSKRQEHNSSNQDEHPGIALAQQLALDAWVETKVLQDDSQA